MVCLIQPGVCLLGSSNRQAMMGTGAVARAPASACDLIARQVPGARPVHRVSQYSFPGGRRVQIATLRDPESLSGGSVNVARYLSGWPFASFEGFLIWSGDQMVRASGCFVKGRPGRQAGLLSPVNAELFDAGMLVCPVRPNVANLAGNAVIWLLPAFGLWLGRGRSRRSGWRPVQLACVCCGYRILGRGQGVCPECGLRAPSRARTLRHYFVFSHATFIAIGAGFAVVAIVLFVCLHLFEPCSLEIAAMVDQSRIGLRVTAAGAIMFVCARTMRLGLTYRCLRDGWLVAGSILALLSTAVGRLGFMSHLGIPFELPMMVFLVGITTAAAGGALHDRGMRAIGTRIGIFGTAIAVLLPPVGVMLVASVLSYLGIECARARCSSRGQPGGTTESRYACL